MKNNEASEKAEEFVLEHLDALLSERTYFAKTWMRKLAEDTEYAAKAYADMCEQASIKTNGRTESFHIHDTVHNSEPYTVSADKLQALADSYKRVGGMDIFALSLDTELYGFAPKVFAEAIEVKVDRKCRYLHLDQPWPPVYKGVIGFELWDNVWVGESEDGRRKPRIAWQPGWLYGYLYPEAKTDENLKKFAREEFEHRHDGTALHLPATYCRPSVLIYVLSDENQNTNELLPYATIAFEDIEGLLSLLKTKAGGELWPKWTIDPDKVSSERLYPNEIHDNMLYVPIEELLQLRGVTIRVGRNIPTKERVHYWATLRQDMEKYWPTKETLYTRRIKYLQESKTPKDVRELRQEGSTCGIPIVKNIYDENTDAFTIMDRIEQGNCEYDR